MMTVGILLPDSTTHPLIAHDVISGFKGAVRRHGIDGIEVALGYIGFGTSAEVVKKETEKLILERDADIIIAFADHPIIDTVFPLIDQLNKLLLVINNGAKYAFDWKAPRNVYFHTLENCFHSFLTSEYAATRTDKAALATSYFDGGYSICHAITQPFTNLGGAIKYNLAGSYKSDEFNAAGLAAFLQQERDTNSLFTVLSGDLLTAYYKQLKQEIPELSLDLYSHPVVLEETLAQSQALFPERCKLTAYTGWFEGTTADENRLFCNTVQADTGRRPTSFGALGWDTALIVERIVDITGGNAKSLTGINTATFPEVAGAKGMIVIDAVTHHFLSDAYRLKYSPQGGLALEESLSAAAGKDAFNRMISQKIEGITSGWLNTYLCS